MYFECTHVSIFFNGMQEKAAVMMLLSTVLCNIKCLYILNVCVVLFPQKNTVSQLLSGFRSTLLACLRSIEPTEGNAIQFYSKFFPLSQVNFAKAAEVKPYIQQHTNVYSISNFNFYLNSSIALHIDVSEQHYIQNSPLPSKPT